MAVRSKPADGSFVQEVHRALLHLYHPTELRRSPLIELLGADRREDPTLALRSLLTGAIRALKPGAGVPPQANAWRLYHVLSQRYVENFAPDDIAASLAVSPRQFRRLHAMSLQALADYLWASHNLAERFQESKEPTDGQALAEVDPEAQAVQAQELEWLKRSCPSETTDVAEVISAVLDVVAPLLKALAVRVECSTPHDVPPLAVQRTALRHALLSILTAVIRCSQGGSIHIVVEDCRPHVCISLQARTALPALMEDQAESLRIARDLAALSGGQLELDAAEKNGHPGVAAVRLLLPAAAQAPVLVIDDNLDALQLYERYLVGTRYRFVGISDPQQALATALEVAPRVIVLDLMLPQIDGWELLGQLRAHPQTRQIPVIVCTILPQEDLALALGAAKLCRKPVSQQAFLAALDSQLAPEFPESQ